MESKEGCAQACPGCRHRSLSPEESAGRKLAFLRRTLEPWADRLEPLRGASAASRWGYRDRACLRAAEIGGRWRAGLQVRGPDGKREVIPIPACPVQSADLNAAVGALLGGLELRGVRAESFPLAWVIVSGRLMTLVLKSKRNPAAAQSLLWTREALSPWIDGFHLNWHPSTGRQVSSPDGEKLWGLELAQGPDGLWYGPGSFGQLRADLHAESLDRAAAHLQPGPGGAIVDLYCGIGASLRRWRKAGAETLGVELGGEAVACAERNAPVRVLRGRCSERLAQVAPWALARSGPLGLYVNPPRTGLEPEVLDWILGSPALRSAYLSCSAGTLARDLRWLEQGSWEVEALVPYDFFPGTHHVEVLALIRRTG
ncbi:MAG: class I SAM-dependent RNA methyltransferase [Bdellovibrionales bacterium]|nr:class I SAM-dependent RNA methyltransferase [Bdellovibrionales bacterium]